MGPLIAASAAKGLFEFVVALGVWTITFIALHRIIVKAGFSGWWIVVPLSPVVAFFIGIAVVIHDVSTTGPFSALGDVIDLEYAIWILCFVNWVFLLLFAFSSWPALESGTSRRRPAAGPGSRTGPVGPRTPGMVPMAQPGAGTAPSVGAGGTGVATAVPVVTDPAPVPSFFCSWCGRERTRDALAIHHCGSRERPAVYCSGCGRGLEQQTPYCASCGTATAQLSPP